MSTCKWLQETEKQAVKLTVSAVEQNPEQGKVFEAFIEKLPGDQLGFHLPRTKHVAWTAWVVWEIEGGPHDGDLLIEVLANGLSEEGLPYHDEATGLRFWQVSVERDEVEVDPEFKIETTELENMARTWYGLGTIQDEIMADAKMKADILSAEQLQRAGDDPELERLKAWTEEQHHMDKLNSGNDPGLSEEQIDGLLNEGRPFTDERGEFDPGD